LLGSFQNLEEILTHNFFRYKVGLKLFFICTLEMVVGPLWTYITCALQMLLGVPLKARYLLRDPFEIKLLSH